MKHLPLLLGMSLIVLGLISISCRSTKTVSPKKPKLTVEDHASEEYRFPPGVYYKLHLPDNMDDFSESAPIKSLTEAGISFTDLWFKRGGRSCRPPGSDHAMMVMVEPVLIIRSDQADLRLLSKGYTEIQMPDMGSCAYSVKHYKLR